MRNTNRLWIRLAAGCLALLLFVPARAEDDAQARYDAAQALYEAEQYQEAYEAFAALEDYADSRERAADSQKKEKAARYKEAVALYNDDRYDEAKAIFDSLGKYKKSASLADECEWRGNRLRYIQAEELFDAGDYQAALEMFEALGKFRKSQEYAQTIREQLAAQEQARQELESYQQGLALKEAGDYRAARDAFIASGDCLDSTDQMYDVLRLMAQERAYKAALDALDGGDLQAAWEGFANLGEYRDSAQQKARAEEAIRAERYERAQACRKDDPAMAYVLLLAADENEAAQLRSVLADAQVYAAADRLFQEGDFARAQAGFAVLTGYQDSDERARQTAQLAQNALDYHRALYLRDLGEQEQANAIFTALGDYENAASLVEKPVPRIPAKRLRDDHTTPKSEVFTAPDGSRHVYQMFKGVHTWREAKVFCEILDGHLATLTTEEENQFVYWFMRDQGFLTAYFGLSDEQRVGNWIWVTGEPFTYTNWHRGEPSRSGRERYGMYFYKHLDGTWNDAHFYEDAEVDPGCSYICEWDLDDPQQ